MSTVQEDPATGAWSGPRKVATAGGVLAVLGIVLLAVAGTLISHHYRLTPATAGERLVVATGAQPVYRGDLALTGNRAFRVLGVGGDRLSGPPLVVNGHPVALPVPGRVAVTVPPGRVYLAGDGLVPLGRIDGVAVATLRGGEFTGRPDTTAFPAAGLPGPAGTDDGLVHLLVLGIAGAAVLLLALLVLAAAGLGALVRGLNTRMDVLAAEDDESGESGEAGEAPAEAAETAGDEESVG